MLRKTDIVEIYEIISNVEKTQYSLSTFMSDISTVIKNQACQEEITHIHQLVQSGVCDDDVNDPGLNRLMELFSCKFKYNNLLEKFHFLSTQLAASPLTKEELLITTTISQLELIFSKISLYFIYHPGACYVATKPMMANDQFLFKRPINVDTQTAMHLATGLNEQSDLIEKADLIDQEEIGPGAVAALTPR